MYKVFLLILALGSFALADISVSNQAGNGVRGSAYAERNNRQTLVKRQGKREKYVRPCHPITNQCVRDNMAANSKCNRNVCGSIPAEYKINTFKFEAPYFNSTFIDNNLVIKNISNCFVSEFFYNVEADVAVLTVDCPGLTLSSNRTLIQHQSGKEDSVYSFTSTYYYPLIRMTTNIYKANAMDLCQSFVFTDVTALPTFIITPNDKQTQNYLSRDLSFVNIYEREMWCAKGRVVHDAFISNKICDFQC